MGGTAMLFVPAAEERKIRKIPHLPGDSVILDLEDSVARSAKESARHAAASVLERPTDGKSIWVRVNPVGSEELDEDLSAVVRPGLAGLTLPKVESARDLHIVDYLVGRKERKLNLQPGSVPLMATIETVAGLRNLEMIVTATPRLRLLCFGAGDFSLDAGVEWAGDDPEAPPSETLTYARAQIVLWSRSAHLYAPHDGAYPRHGDHEGLRTEAEHARRMGFGGKHAIHPDQVAQIGRIFGRPSKSELDKAQRTVEAFDRAEAAGQAAITVDGKLVDYPIAARARQLLAAHDVAT
ncbi:HpcH/HpaI aldolase/citrate lyase family protein [Amycolatopsis pithecellobii]|uniref:CoA ester lyase n=1 Tax=Amycolatopsis pithecellobii TaxID=664692 RepID=A0A6N7Z285_9PSEU|nr:CoA ester lyase [Amycolatopsis pithecellobii]MTD52736.1 CoA ester lyase [Amycolatopsis pithecellobii]